MLSAVSISGSSPQSNAVVVPRQSAPQVDATSAAEAMAALTASQQLQALDAQFDAEIEADTSAAAIYGPNGLPEGAQVPAYAVPSSERSVETTVANSRDPSARLAMESTQLTALLSSLMLPTETSTSATPASPDRLPETDVYQLSRIARESVVAQLYRQF
ncbi:hypothetical protein [Sinorhizobium sp. BG8]|uniref:hypothetical protein n=1 Tax=Sinorhizobium sp. BG8 TaxID=2613773 RepID=UPI00193D8E7E|nr:hypothetical protein [Sinorhizobium sp. BG8]QRM54812.1 hypothetical protein F3Y30_09845 [Sinorhizobium sp. BG8]